MTNDNNIDKLFRDNLHQRDFLFDQKHWEEAEKLLDAKERKRKNWPGGKTGRTVIIIAFILAFTGGFFVVKYSELKNNVQSAGNSPSEYKIKNAASPEKTGQGIENENKLEIIAGQMNPDKPSEKSGYKETSQAGFSQPGTASVPSQAKQSGSMVENYSPDQMISAREEVKSAEDGIYKTKAKKEVVSTEFSVPAGVSEQVGKEKEQVTAAPGNVLDNAKSTEQGHETAEAGIILPETVLPGDRLTSEERKIEPVLPEQVKEQKNEITEQSPETDILLPSVITLNKDVPIAEEKIPAEVAEEKTRVPLKDRLNWLRHLSIGVAGGANISQGFINTGNSRAAINAKPSGGIRIAYQLNEQVDIESGLAYNSRSGLNSSITVLTSRDAGNNIAHYSTTNALSLSYIDLPVHLTYKYGKHSFVVGMHYSQLVNTRNEVIDTKEENGITAVEKTAKQFAKNDGRFSSFDLAGTFGYEYAVTDRIKICGRYNYGLFDVTDDNSFGNSVRDRNNQFRIMVDYRFMKY